MNASVLCNQQEDRLGWLRARMGGLGASDVPKILGLSSWGSPMSVYAEKTLDPDLIEDEGTSPAAELGLELEAWALRKLAENYETDKYGLDGSLYLSHERAHMRCTRDAWLDPGDFGKSVELKTTAFAWEGGEVPPDVFAQIQAQAYVLEEPEIILGAVFRVSGERVFKAVPRDEPFIADMLVACDAFWSKVAHEDPTGLEVDGSEWTAKALARINPAVPGAQYVFTSDEVDIIDEWVAVKEELKEANVRKDLLANQIRAAIGDATMGICPDTRYLNYKEVYKKEYQVKAGTSRPLTGPFGGGR